MGDRLGCRATYRSSEGQKRVLGETQFTAKLRVQEIVGAPVISALTVGDITSCGLPTNRMHKFCLGGRSAR
jgi:hypothetical protein